MWKLAFGCAVMLSGMGSPAVVAQQGAELLVVNQGDRTLSVVDPVTGTTIAAVPVGGVTGHEVAVSPDGQTAFVPIYGDSGVGRPGTDGRSVAVIDVPARKVRGTVEFPHGVRPHKPLYDERRQLLYVTSELDQSVSVIDPHTLRVVGAIPTGRPESHMLVLSHDGRRGYTANVDTGTVSVLDLEGRRLLQVIPVASTVQRIAISNDDRMVFTADQQQPRLAVIDTASDRVVRWVALPDVGYGTAPTPDGRYLLVALRSAGKLAVVDLRSMTVVRTIDVGHGPVEILMPQGKGMAYISCPPDGAVTELAMEGEVSAWKVRRTIKVGAGADGLAWVARR